MGSEDSNRPAGGARPRTYIALGLLAVAVGILVLLAGVGIWLASSDSPDETATTPSPESPPAEETPLPDGARLQLSSADIEFGDISQDATVSHVLEITNVGADPLIIKEVTSS